MTPADAPEEKRRNYPGLISLWCGIVAFISVFANLAAKDALENSLYVDKTASFIYCVCGNLWFLSTALGLLCWFISLFLILPIWGARFRATGAILGLLLPIFAASFIMPTLGLIRSRAWAYYVISDPAAIQYIQTVTKISENIDRSFIKENYEQDYFDYVFDKEHSTCKDTGTIIVKYQLRRGVERSDLSKSFSVTIDRKTKKTTVLPETDTQKQMEDPNKPSWMS